MVIIPAFNEAGTIAEVVRSVHRALPGAPVLVVDDHSNDGTSLDAAAAGARVLRLKKHLGLAGCLQAGYSMARDQGFEIVIRVDGDGQHEADDIPNMLRAMDVTGADVVIGSRFAANGRWSTTLPRAAGVALFRQVAATALGTTIFDPTSGFICVSSRALELLANAQPAPYPEVSALIGLKRNNCRLHEIPCRMYKRRTGRSSMTFLNALRYTAVVLAAALMDPYRTPIVRATPAKHGFEGD